jgi:hypothetical protein
MVVPVVIPAEQTVSAILRDMDMAARKQQAVSKEIMGEAQHRELSVLAVMAEPNILPVVVAAGMAAVAVPMLAAVAVDLPI